MFIKINDIPSSGLFLNRTINAGDIDLADDQEYQINSALAVEGLVENVGDAVIANLIVKGNFTFTCGRCLETVQQERQEKLQLFFDIDKNTDSINIGDDIRQELILCLSKFFLCDDGCKGLCGHCGGNMNKKECTCKD